jgi:dTDP-glucose 4,6-dehydratase
MYIVTGGLGFIGSNLVEDLISQGEEVLVVDSETYAASDNNRFHGVPYFKGDICDPQTWDNVKRSLMAFRGNLRFIRGIFHLAAESHVDNSIGNDLPFLKTNVIGTREVLNFATELGIKIVNVSTDEVAGEVDLIKGDKPFDRNSPIQPRNPYAASKAAAEILGKAYFNTYNTKVITVRPSNNFGPRQHREKLIPKIIINAQANEPIPVYGNGMQIRDWLYVKDCTRGLISAMENGQPGKIYCLGGENPATNIEIVKKILYIMNKPDSLINYVEDRKGHDKAYLVDCEATKKELTWCPVRKHVYTFDKLLEETINWYVR